jgi:hypothetical protein
MEYEHYDKEHSDSVGTNIANVILLYSIIGIIVYLANSNLININL